MRNIGISILSGSLHFFFVVLTPFVFLSCSTTDKAVVDRKANCVEWMNSIKTVDLISCRLDNLGLGEKLDSLLVCVFGRRDKTIYCLEEKNKFSFALTNEPCKSEEKICVRTTKYIPDENCRYHNFVISVGSEFVIKKNNEGFIISYECGDFGCDKSFLQMVENCKKNWIKN